MWDSYWGSLARSGTRSGPEGKLQGENLAEEEGPALRKISAFQGAGLIKDEGLCFDFFFFFCRFFFLGCTLPKPSTNRGVKKKKNLKKNSKKINNLKGKAVRKIFLNFFMKPLAATCLN